MQFQLQMLSNNASHRKMIMQVMGRKVSFISQTFIRKQETVNLTQDSCYSKYNMNLVHF